MTEETDQSETVERRVPEKLFDTRVRTPAGEEVLVEVFDNGTIATTVAASGGLWGGGDGGLQEIRYCEGGCPNQPPITKTCPEGYSPHLDCGTNTLECVKVDLGQVVTLEEP